MISRVFSLIYSYSGILLIKHALNSAMALQYLFSIYLARLNTKPNHHLSRTARTGESDLLTWNLIIVWWNK